MKKAKNKWNSTLNVWQHNVPPARPSSAELALYTKHLRRLQKKLRRRIKMLVLGSTIEFRDWGFEEDMDVTVVDYSRENYESLSSFRRYQAGKERFVRKDWLRMDFENEFDLVVGDSAVGVMKKENVPLLLANISRALKNHGLFIIKQYFKFNTTAKSLEQIIKDHYRKYKGMNILVTADVDIISSEADREGYFNFARTMKKIKKLRSKGILKEEDYRKFAVLGWENLIYDLFVPRQKEWEALIKPYFYIKSIEKSGDVYSNKLPIYFLRKK